MKKLCIILSAVLFSFHINAQSDTARKFLYGIEVISGTNIYQTKTKINLDYDRHFGSAVGASLYLGYKLSKKLTINSGVRSTWKRGYTKYDTDIDGFYMIQNQMGIEVPLYFSYQFSNNKNKELFSFGIGGIYSFSNNEYIMTFYHQRPDIIYSTDNGITNIKTQYVSALIRLSKSFKYNGKLQSKFFIECNSQLGKSNNPIILYYNNYNTHSSDRRDIDLLSNSFYLGYALIF